MNVKPAGGLSLIISLAIITIHNAKKSSKFRGVIFSILIIGAVFSYLSYNMVNDFEYSPLTELGFTSLRSVSYENDCRIIYNEVGERNVVLRLDDIQAETWRDIQIEMLSDVLERDMTISLGVIPPGLLKDREISKFLSDNRCKVDIGLHGYSNEENEFEKLTFKEADDLIIQGLEILNQIEPNVLTFIPPNNLYSEGTRLALIKNEFEVLSAGVGDTEYSFTQSSYVWKDGSGLIDPKEVILGCEKDLDNNKTCVIMLHPQDYADDEGLLDEFKYSKFIKLLEGVEDLDAKVVNFRDLVRKDYLILN